MSGAASAAPGSSPHTRGALALRDQVRAGLRIIPAYAGSTEANSLDGQTMADHPRIRGEHFTIEWEVTPGRGSSPHTRGARAGRLDPDRSGGIIPAYAGSTRRLPPVPQARPDHPRIRGEHGSRSAPRPGPRGSSPHTRGAQHADVRSLQSFGIIPAYAGSTGMTRRIFAATWDHPRIRGEHDAAAVAIEAPPGSSPHTRGAL